MCLRLNSNSLFQKLILIPFAQYLLSVLPKHTLSSTSTAKFNYKMYWLRGASNMLCIYHHYHHWYSELANVVGSVVLLLVGVVVDLLLRLNLGLLSCNRVAGSVTDVFLELFPNLCGYSNGFWSHYRYGSSLDIRSNIRPSAKEGKGQEEKEREKRHIIFFNMDFRARCFVLLYFFFWSQFSYTFKKSFFALTLALTNCG